MKKANSTTPAIAATPPILRAVELVLLNAFRPPQRKIPTAAHIPQIRNTPATA